MPTPARTSLVAALTFALATLAATEARSQPAAPAAPRAAAIPWFDHAVDDGWDDPKLARLARAERLRPRPAGAADSSVRPPPRVKLAYRRLLTRDLEGAEQVFHIGGMELYPVSMRWLRVGVGLDVGVGTGEYSPVLVTSGLSVGVQYPWYITPFVEGRFAAGLIGAMVRDPAGLDPTHQDRFFLSHIWEVGIDAGVEMHVLGRSYVSAAIGWVHPVYSGVDLVALKARPLSEPPRIDISADTFTFRLGLGF